MNKTSAIFHPIIGFIQRIALYETKTVSFFTIKHTNLIKCKNS